MLIKLPSKYIIVLIIQVLILLSYCANAQSLNSSYNNNDELFTDISKFLGRQSNINSLRSREQVYSFNIKIEIKKNNNKIIVYDINASDSIGYKIFPNYVDLKRFNYAKLMENTSHAIVMIPILILNNPTEDKNPNDIITNVNKNSLQKLISSTLYPNIIQKDIILFPLFTINRSDVH